jgi:hypothetical protein
MLKVNELFIGLPWEAQSSIATSIGLVSKYLRGIDLQHYHAPLLTSGSSRINDWSFDPAHPRKFALCNGNLQFYDIKEEATTAHQLLKPSHIVQGSKTQSISQIQYNPVVSCLLVTDSSNSIRIFDTEAQRFAVKVSGAHELLPYEPSPPAVGRRVRAPNPFDQVFGAFPQNTRRGMPCLVKGSWNSDHTTIFASYSDGDCILIDPRSQNAVIWRQALHEKNRSKKAVTIQALTHEHFFLSSCQYQGRLEIKLWDQRQKKEPIQTIDMGSTSAPACMVTDEDCRHLFASARGDRMLRHFSLYDTDRHAPELILKNSYFHRSYIRQLAMVPKTLWEHQAHEIAQLLLCDGSTIDTIHVKDKSFDSDQNIYSPRSPRVLTSSQGNKLNLSRSGTQNPVLSPRNPTDDASKPSVSPCGASSLTASSERLKSLCQWCGRPISNQLRQSQTSQMALELPLPSRFCSVPETFDTAPLLGCEAFLAGDELGDRKRVPITPWGDLTADIAKEFLVPDFADFNLVLTSGETYPIHRCILAARSPFFKKLFDTSPNSQAPEASFSSLDPISAATTSSNAPNASNLPSTVIGRTIKGIEILPLIIERILFYIYTDTLPIGYVQKYADQLTALAAEWGLMQLSRWLENYRKNPDTAQYFSFYQHQLLLLRTKPQLYFSDLSLVPGVPVIGSELADGTQINTDAPRCAQCVTTPTPIKTHRLFAAARNEFLRRLLMSGLQESRSGEVTLDLLYGPALQVFVSSLYSNDFDAEDPNYLMELWEAGEAYFMPELVERVELALRPLVDFDNCIALYDRAAKSTTFLRTYLANFISSRFGLMSEEMRSIMDPTLRDDILRNFTPVKGALFKRQKQGV